MKRFLFADSEQSTNSPFEITEINRRDIAIIGLAVNMPLASDIDTFWENLVVGKDSVRKFTDNRERDASRFLSCLSMPGMTRSFRDYAYLEDISQFDYQFFQLNPKEASLMDPHQRLFLETAHQSIENAGYDPAELSGSKVGVYLGYSANHNYQELIKAVEPDSLSISATGNLTQMIASRISYLFNLTGPSIAIDTTCSSSLVAVHLACQGIRNEDCSMALAGGIKIHIMPVKSSENSGIDSSDGRARPFDESSDGTGAGEGVACVLLKPLAQAIADRNHIYSVIKGSAINQDGRSAGITAPNPAAQEEVIVKAWKDSGIDPETISYIETHGTGTRLGDPIEIDGIEAAFRRFTNKKQFCAIGSIKSGIGHLDSAAGIAGLVKATMALHRREIPLMLHFNYPNKKIDFINSPVYVADKPLAWPSDEPRRAGVSSFGMGGTNCHICLEEAPVQRQEHMKPNTPYTLILSAQSTDALKKLIKKYILYFVSNANVNMHDLCGTLRTGRKRQKYRIVLQSRTTEEAVTQLRQYYLSFNSDSESAYTSGEYDNESVGRPLGSYYKLPLPTSAFDKERCWIGEEGWGPDLLNWKWTLSEAADNPIQRALNSGVLMICNRKSSIERNLEKHMKDKGVPVFKAFLGESFAKIDAYTFIVPNTLDGYMALLASFEDGGLEMIIHSLVLGEEGEADSLEQINYRLEIGAKSLLSLAKAAGSPAGSRREIIFLSKGAYEVTRNEPHIHPEYAAAFGFGKVIGLEYSQVKCKCLDLDDFTSAETVFNELVAGEAIEPMAAFRDNRKYTVEIDEAECSTLEQRPFAIREEGLYLITGGLGGIGIEIASYLASKQKSVRIALVSRRTLPERHEWTNHLKEESVHAAVIRSLIQIEQLGASVETYSADVSDIIQMKKVMKEIEKRHKKIHGLFHCAGNLGKSFIMNKTESQLDDVIRPKIQGTWIIDRLTRKFNMDFFLLFSSFTSLVGAPGQSDYTAANSYLDAYCSLGRRSGSNMTVINWFGWQSTGMMAGYDDHQEGSLMNMTKGEAVRNLDRLLDMNVERAIIGKVNFQLLGNGIQQRSNIKLFELLTTRYINRDDAAHPQSNPGRAPSPYVERSEHEITEEIHRIWSQLLGKPNLRYDDQFYDVGGDSLLLVSVQNHLERSYPGLVSVTDLFAHQSISKLARFIHSKLRSSKENKPSDQQSNSSDDIARILSMAKDGVMNYEEALRKISSMGK